MNLKEIYEKETGKKWRHEKRLHPTSGRSEFDEYIDWLEAKAEEGAKDRKNLERVCCLAVNNSIISRWKCAEMLGLNLADLDEWLDSFLAKEEKG